MNEETGDDEDDDTFSTFFIDRDEDFLTRDFLAIEAARRVMLELNPRWAVTHEWVVMSSSHYGLQVTTYVCKRCGSDSLGNLVNCDIEVLTKVIGA